MAKTRKIMSLHEYPIACEVIKTESGDYRLYKLYTETGADGFLHKHRKLVETFSRMDLLLEHLAAVARLGYPL